MLSATGLASPSPFAVRRVASTPCSTKAALNAVVKSLSIDLKQQGIISVALHPGWVKTDMGGPNAEITTRECVDRLFANLAQLTLADSGRFIDIDGSDIP